MTNMARCHEYMPRRSRSTALAVLLLLSVSPIGAAETPPDLGGTWQLNQELSDDVAAQMRDAINRQRYSSRGDMTPGAGGAATRAGRENAGGSRERSAMRQRLADLSRGVETLVIASGENRLSIRYADGRERVLDTTGEKVKRETRQGEITSRARWKKKGRLEVSTWTERGAEIVQTFQLEKSTGRLLIDTVMRGGPSTEVSFKRVYDLAPEEPSTADGDH